MCGSRAAAAENKGAAESGLVRLFCVLSGKTWLMKRVHEFSNASGEDVAAYQRLPSRLCTHACSRGVYLAFVPPGLIGMFAFLRRPSRNCVLQQ